MHVLTTGAGLLQAGLIAAIALALGLGLHTIVFHGVQRISKRSPSVFSRSVLRHCRRPAGLVFPLFALHLATPLLEFPPAIQTVLKNSLAVVFIGTFIWLLVRSVQVLEDLFLSRYEMGVTDNLQARKVHTQVQLIRKVLVAVILILGAATVLMSFERFRQLGTGLLASAGIAGIVLGLAAQKTLANLLAGIQIAVTQPIRLDDVVIVENEWGRIEEITLTYAVVRIWDLRRLVVPISYFLEKPFQNWTRVSADLLGTVFLYVDYTVPVEEIRSELDRILKDTDLWDGKVSGLVVTNCTDRTMELRALMSAPDSSTAWTLRCHVREKLVAFVQAQYPGSLPKVRAELTKQKGVRPGVPPLGG